MVTTVTHITARALLAGMVLPVTVREQARAILQDIEAGFAPFLVNQSHALGVGMVLGLQAADALSPELLKGLQNVFRAAQRAMLDQLAARVVSNLHAPVLMDEKAAFSAFHVRMTKKEVEAVQGGRYNEGWTEGAHAAWFARSDLARAEVRPVNGACGACGHAVEEPTALPLVVPAYAGA
ncbi:hypothetical protein V2K54_25920 [Pseudomonas alliivorans]|nr:hypothetical protein [Pseudomonas alliivorans]